LKKNSSNTISNCSIYNYYGGSACGIKLLENSQRWEITGNSVYQNAAKSPIGFTCSGIFIDDTTSAGFLVKDNFVGGSATACGGTPISYSGWYKPIDIAAGPQAYSSIQNNTVTNLKLTAASVMDNYMIRLFRGKFQCGNIAGNTIGSINSNDAITVNEGVFAGIKLEVADSSLIQNNKIGGVYMFLTNSLRNIDFYGINAVFSRNHVDISNNQIGSELLFNNIYFSGPGSSDYVAGIKAVSDINAFTSYAIYNNTVANLNCPNAINGIQASASWVSLRQNRVWNLSGSLCNGLIVTDMLGCEVLGNSVHSLTTLQTYATTMGINVYGPSVQGAYATVNGNLVHSLYAQQTNFTPSSINAISVSCTRAAIANNMVRMGLDSLGNSIPMIAITGIGSFNDTAYISHNSVYIGGSPTYSSYAMTIGNRGIAKGLRRITNNILVNKVVPIGPDYKHAALSINDSLKYHYLNNNVYYTTGGLCYLGQKGAAGFHNTISTWRAATGMDSGSVHCDPNFINATGTIAQLNLHLQSPSPAESIGIYEPAITTDFDGDSRLALSPTDAGADAGNFLITDCDPPAFSHPAFLGQPIPSSFVYQVRITDNGFGVDSTGGNKPKMWYRKKFTTVGAWQQVSGSFIAGNLKDGQWGFKPDFTGTTLVPGDSVQYYFVAQDMAANIGYSNIPGTVHTNVNTQVTAPTSPLRLLIYGWFPDTVYVGTGETYTSLTNDDGFFHAARKNLFDSTKSNVTVFITSDLLAETGKYSFIRLNQPQLTIKMATNTAVVKKIKNGVNFNVSGIFKYDALIELADAGNFTLDGSVNGSGRYLDIMNTNTSASSCWPAFTVGKAGQLKILNCIFESNSTQAYLATIGAASIDKTLIKGNLFRAVQPANYANPAASLGILDSFTDSVIVRDNDFIDGSSVLMEPKGTGAIVVDSNHLYNFNAFQNAGTKITAISLDRANTTYNRVSISNNFIGGTDRFCGGSKWVLSNAAVAIFLDGRSNDDKSMTIIENNTIQNLKSIGLNILGVQIASADSVIIRKNLMGSLISDTGIVGNNSVTFVRSSGRYALMEQNNMAGITNQGTAITGIEQSGIQNRIVANRFDRLFSAGFYNNSSTGFLGIKAFADSSNIVERNSMDSISITNTNTSNPTPAVTVACIGIESSGNQYCRIEQNKIGRIKNASRTGTITGINLVAMCNSYIQNNQVSLDNVIPLKTTQLIGVHVNGSSASTNMASINYNSVFITGVDTGSKHSYALYCANGLRVGSLKNNILYNKRTGGTGKHIAVSMQFPSASSWNGAGSSNNLFVTADTALVNEWKTSGVVNIKNWRLLSNGDTASFSTRVADVPADSLFLAAGNGNLNINNLASQSWYVNGKGLPIVGISGDFDSSLIRSTNIVNGPTDIGSDEFNTTVAPPALYVYGKHQLGGADTLSMNGRLVAIINWGSTGTLPTLGTCKWFSGVWPNDTTNNGTIANARFMSGYWQIPATGGAGYTYNISFYYDSSMLGKVADAATMIINKKQIGQAGTWKVVLPTVLNNSSRSLTINNQTSFSEFTATDFAANLPVELLSFNGQSVQKDVLLTWRSSLETNSGHYELERSADAIHFGFIQTANAIYPNGGTYTVTDRDAWANSNASRIYYRLKIVDKAGSFHYSNIVTVQLGKGQSSWLVSVQPNPFKESITVQTLLDNNEKLSFRLLNSMGHLVYQNSISVAANNSTTVLKVPNQLAAGTYILQVIGSNKQTSTALIKQ
jgi:hypothetical protein